MSRDAMDINPIEKRNEDNLNTFHTPRIRLVRHALAASASKPASPPLFSPILLALLKTRIISKELVRIPLDNARIAIAREITAPTRERETIRMTRQTSCASIKSRKNQTLSYFIARRSSHRDPPFSVTPKNATPKKNAPTDENGIKEETSSRYLLERSSNALIPPAL